jgi:hypothetical protein
VLQGRASRTHRSIRRARAWLCISRAVCSRTKPARPASPHRLRGSLQQEPSTQEERQASLSAALDAAIKHDRGADVRALATECNEQAGDPCGLGRR